MDILEALSVERKYPRYALEAEVEVDLGGSKLTGSTRNLSRGGMCATMPEPIAQGSLIRVKISLVFDTDTFSEPLTVPATVVWCTGVGDSYQIGANWGKMDSEQLSYLEMFLRFLEEGKAIQKRATARPPSSDPFE